MTESIAAAAATLIEARRANAHLDALPADQKPATMADAYAIQTHVVSELRDPGPEFGFKIGATNDKAQALLGAEEPFYAELIPALTVDAPHTVAAADLPMIVIEPEFAFKLSKDVTDTGTPWTRESLSEIIEEMAVGIEIVATPYREWTKVGVASLVADNGAHGLWIKGESTTNWRDTDLASAPVTLTVNGEETSTGTGANVLGHPIDSLAWLANKLIADGRHISAGQYVTTGSATPVFPASAGQEIVADFGVFGQVTVTIT